jgi:hypothetical protein
MVVVVASVVLWLSWSHRWCYDCRGHIGGVMVVVVASLVLWLSWSHSWCYGCRGHIGGVMVVVVALSLVDRGFEQLSCQTKDFETDICYFFDNQAALITKRKDWLALNQDNVPEWIDMSTRGLLL